MTIWLNQILQGILLGGYYALIACGLSFMYSVMRIINLAHGSLAVLAAFGLYVLADRFDISPFMGLLIVLPAMAVIGVLLQRLVLDRSARGGLLVPILSTFGLAIVIDNLLFQQFGADTRSLAPYLGSLSYDSWSLTDDIDVGELATLIFATAVVVLGGLHLFLSRTPLGRAIRATAEDPDTVGLVGIDARDRERDRERHRHGGGGPRGLRARHARDLRSLCGRPATDLRVRGGGDRRRRLALGDADRRRRARRGAESSGLRSARKGFLIAGHLVFLAVLFGRLFAAGKPRVLARHALGASR